MFVKKLNNVLRCQEKILLYNVDSTIKLFSSTCRNYTLQQVEKKSYVNMIPRSSKRYLNSQAKIVDLEDIRSILENISALSCNSVAIPLISRENIEVEQEDNLLELSWSSMNNADLLKYFKLLSFYAYKNQIYIHDPKYQNILKALSSRCSEFNDQELHNLMDCVPLWKTDREPLYNSFWTVLDEECLKRMPDWTIDELILTNDQFYHMGLAKLSNFTYKTSRKIGFKLKKLNPSQLIQMAFFMLKFRRFPVPPYEFEYYVHKYVDKLTLEELGIYMSAARKYSISIRDPEFAIKLVNRINNNIDNVRENILFSLFKILRRSYRKDLIIEVENLLNSLESRVSNYNLKTLASIAEVQKRLTIHHDKLMTKILERFEQEIKSQDMTLKHINLVVCAASEFNYDPKTTTIYSAVNDELLSGNRDEELEKRAEAENYSNIVLSMLKVNYYPEDALKHSMEPEFIKKVCNNEKYRLDTTYLYMDLFIEIMHPEYNGPRLEKDLKEYLFKKFGTIYDEQIQKLEKTGRYFFMLEEVASICKKALGSDSTVYVDTIFPHIARRYIVVCRDPETNKFVSLRENLSKIPREEIKYALDNGKKWHIFLLAVGTSITRNTYRPTNTLMIQKRLLERIGYEPLIIFHNEWKNLNDEVEKEQYIMNLLHG